MATDESPAVPQKWDPGGGRGRPVRGMPLLEKSAKTARRRESGRPARPPPRILSVVSPSLGSTLLSWLTCRYLRNAPSAAPSYSSADSATRSPTQEATKCGKAEPRGPHGHRLARQGLERTSSSCVRSCQSASTAHVTQEVDRRRRPHLATLFATAIERIPGQAR